MWLFVSISFIALLLILQFISWRISLFFVSFSPLFLILSIKTMLEMSINQKIHEVSLENILKLFRIYLKALTNNYFWLCILILSIVPPVLFIIRIGICIYRESDQVSPNLTAPSQLDDGIVSYVMTYIVPLTSLSFSSNFAEYTSNVMLFLIIMILYIRMNLVYLNPVLIILGFNIFKATIEQKECYILTRNNFSNFSSIIKKPRVSLLKLNSNFFFLKLKK